MPRSNRVGLSRMLYLAHLPTQWAASPGPCAQARDTPPAHTWVSVDQPSRPPMPEDVMNRRRKLMTATLTATVAGVGLAVFLGDLWKDSHPTVASFTTALATAIYVTGSLVGLLESHHRRLKARKEKQEDAHQD